jgi:hypothetical protein
LILCVYAISKKYLKPKRNPLFDLRFFYLSRGEEREDKKRKTKKEQYTHRINSNLPGESIARERERVLFLQTERHSKLLFLSLLECHSLLQKTIPEIEKRKESITLKK